MRTVHLVEGPVGAGKSTFARELAKDIGGAHVALDEWFVQLFSLDRPRGNFVPWYVERKQRLIDLIWTHALTLAAARTVPILELGLIRRQDREPLYARALAAEVELVVHWIDAPQEVRRARVRRRNEERGATFSMVVPEDLFEMASSLWEPPDEDELLGLRIFRDLACRRNKPNGETTQ